MQTIIEPPGVTQDSFRALTVAVHPAWHQAILRLASATERVAARMDAWGAATNENGNFVSECRKLAKSLIDFLDEVDADPDLEPSLGYYSQPGFEDLELNEGDDEPSGDEQEPSLGSISAVSQTHWAAGNQQDLESEHDGREPDDEGDGAPEYDAAQERGEIAGQGKPSRAEGLATAADAGLTYKDIHEARIIRDAEKRDPIAYLCRKTERALVVLAKVTLI